MTDVSVEQTVTRRRARHQARSVLWQESKLERVRFCGARAVGKFVGVKAGQGCAGFSALETCGSTWACPVCSHKISSGRADELGKAISAHAGRGGKVAMLTLTMRHRDGQSLRSLWDALSYAWGKVTSGRAWQSEKGAHGVEGWVRVVEVTHGKNGWHVHVHALLFLAAGQLVETDVQLLGRQMFTRWRDALVRKGMQAPLANLGGLDIKLLNVSEATDELAAYLAKATYTPGSAGWELAGGSTKEGRHGNRTPFGLLRDVVEHGDADALDAWHEYELVSKGKRQMTWQRGFREQLLADMPELTDQELADLDELHGDLVLVIPAKVWRSQARWHSATILERASESPAQLKEWLDGAGIAWQLPPTAGD